MNEEKRVYLLLNQHKDIKLATLDPTHAFNELEEMQGNALGYRVVSFILEGAE